MTAPVALFIFDRPQLTAQVYERIRAARPSRFLVIADGPRATRPGEEELCEEARRVVSSPDWACELLTNFAPENSGCRRRLSSGLEWVFQQCSEAIILEDDCIPSASFFPFCTEMLSRYRDDSRIMHVSGDNFQDGQHRGTGSYYFSRYPHTWGWASWRRAWRFYDVNLSAWPAAYSQRWLESIWDDPEEVRYWDGIFDRQYRGRIDTWDYQWMFACWRQGGLSILPNENLVTNVGLGPDATHFTEDHCALGRPAGELGDLVHPTEVVADLEADHYSFVEYIAGKNLDHDGDWLYRVRRRLRLRQRVRQFMPRSLRYR